MSTSTAYKKFCSFRSLMHEGLIEREVETDLLLCSVLSREHTLLVGPPGTAKTLMIDKLMEWFEDGLVGFKWCFNKYTEPNEIFGHRSIKALRDEDKYTRITHGKLPEAHFAFLDEYFKASTAILNAGLKILLERLFDNGEGEYKVPLITALMASNEFNPDREEGGRELAALQDRILFRKKVDYIKSRSGRYRLLRGEFGVDIEKEDRITLKEMNSAIKEVNAVEWTDEGYEAFEEILSHLWRKDNMRVGDRRLVKSKRAVQAHAWLNGNDSVQLSDLSVLQHVLWEFPEEQPEKVAAAVVKVAPPSPVMEVNNLLMQAEDVIATDVKPSEIAAKLEAIRKKMDALKSSKSKDRALRILTGDIKKWTRKSITF